jgi:agmatinase
MKSNPHPDGLNLSLAEVVRVVVLGVPLDANASYITGPRLAPAEIRAVLHSGASNWAAENGLELDQEQSWVDLGDLVFTETADPFEQIAGVVGDLLEQSARVFTLGGDHSITYPILRAFHDRYPKISILQIDAHPDLYDSFEGSRRSHACPFARIMEAGLAQELVQVGIRTMNQVQREQAERFGIRVIEMKDWPLSRGIQFNHPVYLSLDMDGLDPAFAPGVSHQEAGGLTTREVIRLIQSIDQSLIGADLVEFNPDRDPTKITGGAAAKLYKEIIARLLTD